MSEPMDPERLRRLFADAESKLTPVAPPLAVIAARAAARRAWRWTVMGISALAAAAAVVAVVLGVNLASSPAASGPVLPGGGVSSSPAISSAFSSPTASSPPLSTPVSPMPPATASSVPPGVGDIAATLTVAVSNPPAPATRGLHWAGEYFDTGMPTLALQVPDGWRPYYARVGQTAGLEWVNPADPDQRIAVVQADFHCFECTIDPTLQNLFVDSFGGINDTNSGVEWTSTSDDDQQGYFTDTSHIDDFCLNGDSDNPASGKVHEPYIALGYARLAQTPFVGGVPFETYEVFAWTPTTLAHTVLNSITLQPATTAMETPMSTAR